MNLIKTILNMINFRIRLYKLTLFGWGRVITGLLLLLSLAMLSVIKTILLTGRNFNIFLI